MIMTIADVSQICLFIFLTLMHVWCRQIFLVLALQLPHPHLLYLLWYATSVLLCACRDADIIQTSLLCMKRQLVHSQSHAAVNFLMLHLFLAMVYVDMMCG